MTELDRAVGALLGLAVGDAVGTTLEFKAPGTFAPISDMVGGGPFRLAAGEWTDDTSMALCLAESILDTGAMDLDDQLRRYLLWKDEGYLSSNGRCFDIGNTTRTQLERYRRTGEPTDPHVGRGRRRQRLADAARARPDPLARRSGRGGGAVGGVEPDDASGPAAGGRVPADGRDDRRADQRCVVRRRDRPGLLAVGRAPPGGRGDRGGRLEGEGAAGDPGDRLLRRRPRSGAVGGRRRRRLRRGRPAGGEPRRGRRHDGRHRRPDRRCPLGRLLHPAGWRDKVVAAPRIEALARGLFVAGGGAADEPAWPHDATCTRGGWSPDGCSPGSTPGHIDAVRARRKVDLLVDCGIRTFVDLTTPADGLDPYGPIVDAVATARRLDLRQVSFPIPDVSVVDDEAYDTVTTAIEAALARGGVYVHCWGGVGRTATVVGCILADQGLDYPGILERLDTLRVGAARRTSRHPKRHPSSP